MEEREFKQLNSKLDSLGDDISELNNNVKDIYKQLPNDESLQTKESCKDHQAVYKWLFGGVGICIIGIVGWLFKMHDKIRMILEKVK